MASKPKQIEIGPLVWKVDYDPVKIKESGYAGGGGMFGVTFPSQLEICVDPDRPEQGIRETLLHEVLHAVIWTVGIDAGDDDEEEVLVAQLSTAILDVLRRNKALVRYLTALDEDAK